MTMLKPIYDRILVQPEEVETKTSGGIFIPDSAQEKPQRGKVIAVGTGRLAEDGTMLPMILKPSDEIIYGKIGGSEIEVEGKKYLMMRETDVLAIVVNSYNA